MLSCGPRKDRFLSRREQQALREALAARPDDDFVLAAPPRRSRAAPSRSGRSTASAKQPGIGARALAFAWRYPLEIAISIGLSAAAFAIIWNALALQTARHPAPLFSPRGQRTEQPAPLPPMRPGPAFAEPQAPPAAYQAPVSPSQPAAPAIAVPPPRPTGRDAIGDAIRGGEAPAAQPKSAPVPLAAMSRPAPARDAIGDLIRLGEPAPI